MMTRATFLIAVLMLGGCAASLPPVQVTRFHLGGQIAPGTVTLGPGIMSLEGSSYRAAVSSQLARLGFADAGSQTSRYLVSVGVDSDRREAPVRRSPVTIGVGGGTGGYGGGVGLGASFGLGGNRSRDNIATRLSVQMRDRATNSVVWEGRAETDAPSNAPGAQPALAVDKLATALFRDFPGESGRTISVP